MPPSFTRSSGTRLDKAGVRRRPLVGDVAARCCRRRIDEPVALRRAIDAVRPIQSRVEPLRRVRARDWGPSMKRARRRTRGVLLPSKYPCVHPSRSRRRPEAEHLARVGLPPRSGEPAAGSDPPPSHSGTPSSGAGRLRWPTPALRQYFCARMSTATWDHWAGACSVASKTTEPSGLTILDVRSANSTQARTGRLRVRCIAFRSALLPPRPRPFNGSPHRRGRRGRVGNTRQPVGRSRLCLPRSLCHLQFIAWGRPQGPREAPRATMLAPQWTTATRSTSRAPSIPSRPSRRPSTPPACSGSASASPGTGSTTLFLTSPEAMNWVSGYRCKWSQAESPRPWPAASGIAVHVDHDRYILFDTEREAALGASSRPPPTRATSRVRASAAAPSSSSTSPRARLAGPHARASNCGRTGPTAPSPRGSRRSAPTRARRSSTAPTWCASCAG